MADANQIKPGSLSRETPRTTGAPVGSTHGGGNGSRAVEEAKEMGTELIGAVREGATSFFEEQRHRAASEIAALGDVLRQSARSLDHSGSTSIWRYAEDAASEIRQFADRLRTRSLGMMADDVEAFARQWPAAFMAVAVGAGFLAGRFLVSSASRPASQTMTSPMPQPASTTGQPIGGARHDFGAVGGPVTGGANAGYGVGGTRETR
jgi:hypothetical protein